MKTPSSLSLLRSFFDSLDWSKLQDEVAGEAKARLVIAGPVNSGKSTLFNLLQGQVVSPVSAVPGTTQTTVVEQFGPFTLVDTPGFGEAGDDEHAAVARAEIKQAKMVLLLLVMQARMVLRLGAIYGENITGRYARELVSAMAGALVARYIGEELAKFVPGPGWLIGAAVAAAGTLTMGRLAESYFQSGGQLEPALLGDWVRSRLATRPARQTTSIQLRPRPEGPEG